ncbi:MAG: alpha/beta fold hydrolase [Georgenia sp.]
MRLNVRTWGTEGEPTCVVLHGITANAGAWVHMGPALASLGLHVHAPELRGHGDSPAEGPFDYETLLRDLQESVPSDPALLVGHSFGGYLAQRGVLDGLFTPGGLLLEDPVSYQPDAAVPTAMLTTDESGIPRSVDGVLAANPGWSRLDAAWKVLSLEQVNWDGARAAFAGNAPWDLRDDAACVAALTPTMWVLPGESRFVPPADVERLRREVGEERLVIAPQAGHSVHRDEPELFLATAAALLSERANA